MRAGWDWVACPRRYEVLCLRGMEKSVSLLVYKGTRACSDSFRVEKCARRGCETPSSLIEVEFDAVDLISLLNVRRVIFRSFLSEEYF